MQTHFEHSVGELSERCKYNLKTKHDTKPVIIQSERLRDFLRKILTFSKLANNMKQTEHNQSAVILIQM